MTNSRAIPARTGFTLVEMVVVISIIAALAGMGIPIYMVVMRQMKVAATRTLVDSVAMQISRYNTPRWFYPINYDNPPTLRSGNTFAMKTPGKCLNGRNEKIPFLTIDGRPKPSFIDAPKTTKGVVTATSTAQYDEPFVDEKWLVASGYMGFYDMVGAPIPKQNLNNKHQIIDAWKEPLRIAYAANVYGATRGFGVWSAGPDRIDQDLDTRNPRDDLCSWIGKDDPNLKKK